MRILLVEDDNMIGESLLIGLKSQGYAVDWVKMANDALYGLETEGYDILLLDLGLPDYSGLELLQKIRRSQNKIPTLILTARDSIKNKVDGLDAGADDYLVKPFSLDELSARIRALLRRNIGVAESQIEYSGLTLNLKTYEATLNGVVFKLSSKEFALFSILLENPGVPFSRSELENRMYGWNDTMKSNTVEVFIHSLRQKFGSNWIKNMRGLGYFVPKHP